MPDAFDPRKRSVRPARATHLARSFAKSLHDQRAELLSRQNIAYSPKTDLSDNPDFVAISKAYKIHGQRISEDAMREFPISQQTSDELDRFLRSPHAELMVFDTAPEANVFPMVPAGASLSEMLLEEE